MKKHSRERTIRLTIILTVIFISFFAWDTVFVYPLKLFVVLLHEMSHGLAAVLTGGRIAGINVNEYLGGLTTTEGGNTIIIASAGYLGSLVFGLLLFYSSYDKKVSLWFCTGLAVLFLIFTANFIEGMFGKLFALIITVLLIVSPRFFNYTVHKIWIQIIGILSSIYVLIDIKEDLITKNAYQTDTVLLETVTGIPAYLIGIIWFVITLLALYFVGKKLFKE